MAFDNNIKKITAADIEKYHKGLLTDRERNALEKAALEDPFLADALEGYKIPGVNAELDLEELKSRITERTAGSKAITMHTKRRTVPVWWKAAALIILIGGAGVLAYRLAFINNNQTEIAQLETENKVQSPVSNDSLEKPVVTSGQNSSTAAKENISPKKVNGLQNSETVTVSTGKGKQDAITVEKTDNLSTTELKKESVSEQAFAAPPPVIQKSEQKNYSADKQVADKKVISGEIEKQQPAITLQNKSVTISGKNNEIAQNSYFRGRVTDAVNNPLPFANITNVTNNSATYSDANGYFTLSAPDSVINARVSSVGFENNNIQLRNRAETNQVILEENRNSLSEVVIVNNSSLPDRSKESRKAGEINKNPEPADGWRNYNLYLLNNLRKPEKIEKSKMDDFVEISFAVNTAGRPVNIRVEKSLSKTCDAEAIRLVKEGPKWETRGKKSRARVTVPFND